MTVPEMRSFRRPGWAFWACVSLTNAKLWLVRAQTITVFAPARVDDALFIGNALHILGGQWLGPFTDVTLAKGPIFPIWLALNHLVGVPLLLSQALLYAFACGVLVLALHPIIREPWRQALLYVVLLFNPATWADGPATRVIREGIYPALVILLMAFAIGAVLRIGATRRTVVTWAVLGGASGALVAMTREEGIWLAPSLLLLIGYGVWLARKDGRARLLVVLGATAAAYLGPVAVVSAINWKSYGVFQTTDMRGSEFASAYGALTRVKASRWHPYVPIPREARIQLYAASPTLADIAAVLEDSTRGWAEHGCTTLGVCDDISGGSMPWALRESAAKVGVYTTGTEAGKWYERVAREVNEACGDGRLQCYGPRATLMPPWRSEYVLPTVRAFLRAAKTTITLDQISPEPSGSRADRDAIARVEWFTNEKIPEPVVHLEGVVTLSSGQVHAAVFDSRGRRVEARIEWSTPPSDRGREGDGSVSSKLSVETRCSVGCVLALFTPDRRSAVVPVTEGGGTVRGDGITWSLERFARTIDPGGRSSQDARLRVLRLVTSIYAVALGPLLIVATVLYLRRGLGARRARAVGATDVIATAFIGAAAARFLLVALVDATSFPAVEVSYLTPAYPFLIGFVSLLLLATDRGPSHAENA
jgi:hypothetical protein